MLILSILKNVERMNERTLLVRFLDNSIIIVDGYKDNIDIISKQGMTNSWANCVNKDDIKSYWDILAGMVK